MKITVTEHRMVYSPAEEVKAFLWDLENSAALVGLSDFEILRRNEKEGELSAKGALGSFHWQAVFDYYLTDFGLDIERRSGPEIAPFRRIYMAKPRAGTACEIIDIASYHLPPWAFPVVPMFRTLVRSHVKQELDSFEEVFSELLTQKEAPELQRAKELAM